MEKLMKRTALTILFVSLMTMTPAYATGVEQRFNALLLANGVTHFNGVNFGPSWLRGTKPPGLVINWNGSQTAGEVTTAMNLSNSFDWLDMPDPDTAGFLMDCCNDTTLPGAAYPYFPYLCGVSSNPVALKAVYARLKSAYGATWLTAAVQTKIETYAAARNMPLI